MFVGTWWSLMPPIIAILLALLTKEVYLSLFAGCALGALLVAEFHPWVAFDTLFNTMIDSVDFSILMFMILLGMVVMLMQESGGTRAYGEWAAKKLKSKRATLVATSLLGALIFVDDYFNCLTVGSVMRPVTDKYKVSRAKLAYLIDATAAPVCIIAPVSSWAAAVTSSVPEGSGINGFTMFLRTIPYNYYALLTLVMIFFLVLTGADYGPMKLNEDNALNGDLFTTDDRPYGDDVDDGTDTRGHVIDLILPVVVLIAACIFGLIYTGGLHPGGLQGHGQPHADPHAGMDPFRHDQPAGRKILRREPAERLGGGPAVPAARHHLPRGGLPRLCHRHFVGHLLHPDPHRLPRLPAGRDAGHLHRGVPVRRGLRRPLLPHLRYLHHGLGGRPLQPCEPCVHPAALCHHRGRHLGGLLRHHRPEPDRPRRQRQPFHLAGPAGCGHCAGADRPQRHPRQVCGPQALIPENPR